MRQDGEDGEEEADQPKLTAIQQIARAPARTDILNVIEVLKPTQAEFDAVKPPDMHEIINKGLLKSLNQGGGDLAGTKTAVPLALLKVKLNKLAINSLAEVGFQDFKTDAEKDPRLRKEMEKHMVQKTQVAKRRR